jgi:cytochrome c biogenesis protein CcdA
LELILIFIGIPLYFLPSIVAMKRDHHQTMAIAVLNFFTGWTFIGWVAALVWACTQVHGTTAKRQPIIIGKNQSPLGEFVRLHRQQKADEQGRT